MFYGFIAVRVGRQLIPSFSIDPAAIDRLLSTVEHWVLTPLALVTTAVLVTIAVRHWTYAFDVPPWLPRVGFPLEPDHAVSVEGASGAGRATGVWRSVA